MEWSWIGKSSGVGVGIVRRGEARQDRCRKGVPPRAGRSEGDTTTLASGSRVEILYGTFKKKLLYNGGFFFGTSNLHYTTMLPDLGTQSGDMRTSPCVGARMEGATDNNRWGSGLEWRNARSPSPERGDRRFQLRVLVALSTSITGESALSRGRPVTMRMPSMPPIGAKVPLVQLVSPFVHHRVLLS